MPPKILEIACFNMESALYAEKAGADRIELCQNYTLGGLTPSPQMILEARQKINIPVFVIIRPHANGFMYDKQALDAMKESIHFCKTHKIDGVVFGVLNSVHQIDRQACEELLALAHPMAVTFHRAIDHCENYNTAIGTLIDLGFNRVLTSGATGDVERRITNLKQIQQRYGQNITIIPGGGLRADNLKLFFSSACKEYHSSAITDNSEFANAGEITKLRQMLDQTN